MRRRDLDDVLARGADERGQLIRQLSEQADSFHRDLSIFVMAAVPNPLFDIGGIISGATGMPLWQDHLFIAMSRSANDATDYFQIPTGRVVEVGTQVTI